MRIATNDTAISKNRLHFGHGYCAEHEWGYNQLAAKLGLTKYPHSFQECLTNSALLDKVPQSIEDFRIQNTSSIETFETEFLVAKPSSRVLKFFENNLKTGLSTEEACHYVLWKEYCEQFKVENPKRKTVASLKTPVFYMSSFRCKDSSKPKDEAYFQAGTLTGFNSRYKKIETSCFVLLKKVNPSLFSATASAQKSEERTTLIKDYIRQLCEKHNIPDYITKRQYLFLASGRDVFLEVAWNSTSFAVSALGDSAEYLKEISKAVQDKRAFLGFKSSDNPFGRGSLCIYTEDEVNSEEKETISASWTKLKEDVLEAKAAFADKLTVDKFYALTAPRITEKNEKVYFLNPRDQKKYNHGWFTSEQINEWLTQDKGPIVRIDAEN